MGLVFLIYSRIISVFMDGNVLLYKYYIELEGK